MPKITRGNFPSFIKKITSVCSTLGFPEASMRFTDDTICIYLNKNINLDPVVIKSIRANLLLTLDLSANPINIVTNKDTFKFPAQQQLEHSDGDLHDDKTTDDVDFFNTRAYYAEHGREANNRAAIQENATAATAVAAATSSDKVPDEDSDFPPFSVLETRDASSMPDVEFFATAGSTSPILGER